MTLTGKNILLVDDEIEILEILEISLLPTGANLFRAKNGIEALEIAKNQHIDLVLSDIRMPQCTGNELLIQLKASLKVMPRIIFITGFSDYTRSEALESGADDYVQKPFDLEDIADAAKSALK